MQLTDNQYIINTGNLPYKQGVVGSNPSAPTNIKIKEYNQKLYSFFYAPSSCICVTFPRTIAAGHPFGKDCPPNKGTDPALLGEPVGNRSQVGP